MRHHCNDLHLKQIEAWKKKNSNLSEKELPQLFINGIVAIHRKSLMTLSNVTVTAVVDRILHECQERFPALDTITNNSSGLHFKTFSDQIITEKPKDIQVALQEFLLELLEVFGKITAGILTKKLHQELMTVTIQALPQKLEPKAVVSLGLARKKRDLK